MRAAAWAAALLLARPAPAAPPSLSGAVEAFYSVSDRRLDDSRHHPGVAGTLRAAHSFPSVARLEAEARGQAGSLPDPDLEIRRLHLDLALGPVDIRAGRQIIKWGAADGINPTDYLSPKERASILRDDDDARLGLDAIKAVLYGNAWDVEAAVAPWFRGSRTPAASLLPRDRLYRGFPDFEPQLAARATARGSGWNASLSAAAARDPEPAFAFDGAPRYVHPAYRAVGGDISGVAGTFGLRGEWAYMDYEAASPRRDMLTAITGVDRSLAEGWYGNLQVLLMLSPGEGSAVPGQDLANNQARRMAAGLVVKLERTSPGGALAASVTGVWNVRDGDSWTRTATRYAVTDHVSASLVGEWFRGGARTYLGGLEKNSLIRAGLQYAF